MSVPKRKWTAEAYPGLPGVWRVVEGEGDDADVVADELSEEVARLIAAAPELYGALEWYADEVMAYSLTQVSEPRSAVHADKGARARAALAKARGEGNE